MSDTWSFGQVLSLHHHQNLRSMWSNHNGGIEISTRPMPIPIETSPPVPEGGVIETGTINNIDHNEQRVNFARSYVNPIVVLGVLSYNGGDPSTVRAYDVDSNGFSVKIMEWAYLDGPHTTESLSWMVVEQGCYNPLEEGGYCAGKIDNRDESFVKVTFPEKMQTPVVFT